MTATLGLERLPRPIATLVDEAAANLLTIANEFDALVPGDASALDAIARRGRRRPNRPRPRSNALA